MINVINDPIKKEAEIMASKKEKEILDKIEEEEKGTTKAIAFFQQFKAEGATLLDLLALKEIVDSTLIKAANVTGFKL